MALRSDFTDHDDCRIVALEADCLRRIKEKTAAAGREDDDRTLFVMRDGSQLLLCDDDHTYRVRRVEYSNSLLLAEERPMCSHDAQAFGNIFASFSKVELEAVELKKRVVFSSAQRLFEAKRASVCQNVFELLKKSFLTIEELEASESERSCGNAFGGTGQLNGEGSKHHTFSQLAAMSHCSARELADALSKTGAVVHNGHVRLLHPSLLHESLQAVVYFFEGSEIVSWDAAEAYLCPSAYPHVVIRAVHAIYGANDLVESATGAAAVLCIKKVLLAFAAAAVAVVSGHGHADASVGTGNEGTCFPTVDFERFYDTWVESIPTSFFASGAIPQRFEKAALMSLINGFGIICGAHGENYAGASLVWAPKDELPTDVSKRVALLFELSPGRWAADALRAYIEPLLDPGVAFEHMIHRHAKEFQVPNQPVMYGRLA